MLIVPADAGAFRFHSWFATYGFILLGVSYGDT